MEKCLLRLKQPNFSHEGQLASGLPYGTTQEAPESTGGASGRGALDIGVVAVALTVGPLEGAIATAVGAGARLVGTADERPAILVVRQHARAAGQVCRFCDAGWAWRAVPVRPWYALLRAELFAHRSAELSDDGSAEFHDDAADGERRDHRASTPSEEAGACGPRVSTRAPRGSFTPLASSLRCGRCGGDTLPRFFDGT